jgi:hypothetical protein
MEFKALRVPSLTEEVAKNLELLLENLIGVISYDIKTDTRELHIVFDEHQLGFKTLIQELAEVGCSLKNIDAALLL